MLKIHIYMAMLSIYCCSIQNKIKSREFKEYSVPKSIERESVTNAFVGKWLKWFENNIIIFTFKLWMDPCVLDCF